MPVYEYKCESCDHQLDKFQKTSDPDPIDCPECKKPKLKRQMSAAAFALKGTGWYVTDFKNDNKKKTPNKTDSKKDSKETSTDSKTDSKKDSKADNTKTTKSESTTSTSTTTSPKKD